MSLPNFDLRRHSASGPGSVTEEDEGDAAAHTRVAGEAGATSRRRATISNGTDVGSWQSRLGLDAGVTRLQFGTLLTHFSASVLFLVFLNSVQPLYISQLARPAHKSDPEQVEIRLGLLTGQLAFADELTSVFMVLVWGALADRIGIRIVACVGYCFVAAGLTCYALATKPWPHLLWCRLMFAIGGSAVTAMLTASLAAYSASPNQDPKPSADHPDSSEQAPLLGSAEHTGGKKQRHGRLSALAGLFTGLGAVVSVFVLLPLPIWLASLHERDRKHPTSSEDPDGAVRDPALLQGTREALLIAASISVIVASVVAIGLSEVGSTASSRRRDAAASRRTDQQRQEAVANEVEEATTNLNRRQAARQARRARLRSRVPSGMASRSQQGMRQQFSAALRRPLAGFRLAAQDRSGKLYLAYLSGALARGITIASTLFLPLLIAHYFYLVDPSLCPPPASGTPPSEIKRTCRKAYSITSAQSGILQTVALLLSPLVGFGVDSLGSPRVILVGSLSGFLGFLLYGVGLPGQGDPRAAQAWIAAVLLGICQIVSIVASLALVAHCKHQFAAKTSQSEAHDPEEEPAADDDDDGDDSDIYTRRHAAEIARQNQAAGAGAIAGAYSSTGALSILLLSSIGGWLFDLKPSGPFLILAVASAIVCVASAWVFLRNRPRHSHS